MTDTRETDELIRRANLVDLVGRKKIVKPAVPTPSHGRDSRPDVYMEGDTYIVRGSAFGNCSRALGLALVGEPKVEPPHVVRRGMDEGTAFEDEILKVLPEHGWRLLDELSAGRGGGKVDESGQFVMELPIGKRLIVRLHPDGVATNFRAPAPSHHSYVEGGPKNGDLRVVEAKFLIGGGSGRAWDKPGYGWQLACEMAASGLPAIYLTGVKERAEDESVSLREVRFDLIDDPPFTRADILRRGLGLVKMFDRIRDEGPGALSDCDVRQWPCGWYQNWHDGQAVHSGALVETVAGELVTTEKLDLTTALPHEKVVAIRAWLADERKYAEQETKAKALKENAKAKAIELIGELDEGAKATFDGWSVSRIVKPAETRTVDYKAVDRIEIRAPRKQD